MPPADFLQFGALGLLALVLIGCGWFLRHVVTSLEALRDILSKLTEAEGRQNELLRQLVDDVYNGRCRYGPSGAAYHAAARPREGGKLG